MIDMPLAESLLSATNACRVKNNILVGSEISSMKATDENYLTECNKIELWTKICAANGLELVVFNLSELAKASGAALSCCIMHLTYSDYQKNLL